MIRQSFSSSILIFLKSEIRENQLVINKLINKYTVDVFELYSCGAICRIQREHQHFPQFKYPKSELDTQSMSAGKL